MGKLLVLEKDFPLDDVVKVNGKVVRAQLPKAVTIAINKPKGYTCSNHDEYAERLIFELSQQAITNAALLCREARCRK